jgi:hypothetical protein
MDKKIPPYPLLVLLLDPGSVIRDPRWIKIRIRDPGKTSLIRNTVHMMITSVGTVLG